MLSTLNNLGILCEQVKGYDLLDEMNTRVLDAGKRMDLLYNDLGKDLRLNSPYPYSREHQFVCDFKSHDPKMYDAYWYHPDHLGSSSYITNTTGEISQHMEYLPFGEALVEEHRNSYNSPFKFNGKEFDAETGNYYYGARYYGPKWNIFLTPDPALESYPGISPYAYTLNNPINLIDPDGRDPIHPRTGKSYRINLHRHAPIYATIKQNNNPDNVLLNRINNLQGKLFGRGRAGDNGWARGHSIFYHDLAIHLFSNGARNSLKSLLNSDSVYAPDAPIDSYWIHAASSGSYSFLSPTYAESEFFFRNEENIQAITVADNYITQIVNLSRSTKDDEYDISQVVNFNIEKGDIKYRERKSFFGSGFQKYRILNVTETVQDYVNNKPKGEENTINYKVEQVLD